MWQRLQVHILLWHILILLKYGRLSVICYSQYRLKYSKLGCYSMVSVGSYIIMAQFWGKTHTLIIQSHILYISIINFCCLCSKLPGKKLIILYKKLQYMLESIRDWFQYMLCSKWKQLITVFCFDNSFYVSIQLIFKGT